MAWCLTKLRDSANNARYKEFDCETESDIATLPGLEECDMGSLALVWEGGLVYKLNSEGRWVQVG